MIGRSWSGASERGLDEDFLARGCGVMLRVAAGVPGSRPSQNARRTGHPRSWSRQRGQELGHPPSPSFPPSLGRLSASKATCSLGADTATYPVTEHKMTRQEPSPSNFPAWQREYEAALHEPDPKKLLECVHAVEAAIFTRLQEFAQTSENTDHKAEEQAIAEALRTLRVLKRDKLQFADWETQ
jgi:hypothetical protein